MKAFSTTMSNCRRVILFVCLTANCPAAQPDFATFADGTRDATQALQAAIDSAGGLLELPPGNFRISKTLVVELAQTGHFELRGSAASTLQMYGAGPVLRFKGSHFNSADPQNFTHQIWEKERMPRVSGIAIEGKHAEADGISASGTMQLTISHVHFRKLRHGVHLVENNRNLLIDNCHIYECRGVGVFYDNVNLHQSNIIGCHISYCDQGGIVSRGGNVRNIHITGCDIESNMSTEQEPTANILIDCRGSQYGTAEVAITGCTIQHNDRGPQSANIRILGGSNPSQKLVPIREGNVTITGNVLSDVQSNIHLDSCRGVTLTGNTFWMGFDYNLLIENSSHIVVGPNNFDRNPRYDYGHATEAKNRIAMHDCQDCTLSGIHISNITQGVAAVTLERCHRFNVSALTILDCDLGLQLVDVSNSIFSSCLIRDDRQGVHSENLVIRGGVGNTLDATLK